MEFAIIYMLFFVIAVLYSSAGFGGGSSYLAILALFEVSYLTMRPTALLCNIVVVAGSVFLFAKNGRLHWTDALWYVVLSIPAAFIGGYLLLEQSVFFVVLGLTLLTSATLMWIQSRTIRTKTGLGASNPPKAMALGGGIGFLAGLVGIGGGIFLSPALYLMRWAEPHRIAGITSLFILVNSIAGFTGHLAGSGLLLDWNVILGLAASVFVGGQVGTRLTLRHITPIQLKRLTAVLIFFIGIRILYQQLVL